MAGRKSPHEKVRSDSSLLKNAKGASAAAAGSLIHTGIVLRKRLKLKESVYVEYCWNL